jgi:hypothetical protein
VSSQADFSKTQLLKNLGVILAPLRSAILKWQTQALLSAQATPLAIIYEDDNPGKAVGKEGIGNA